MNQSESQTPLNSKHQPNSGFLSGMMIGTALGAAGHFLLGTPKGKQLTEDIVDIVREELEELGVLDKRVEVGDTSRETRGRGNEPRDNSPETNQYVKEPSVLKSQISNLKSEIEEKEYAEVSETAIKIATMGVEEAKRQADAIQESLKQAASRIEKKFFKRRGRSLKK